MTRMNPGLRETAQELIDEVMFRFSFGSREAQALLQEVLKDRGIVNAVCVRIQLLTMEETEGGVA